jgi:hypothetical protein
MGGYEPESDRSATEKYRPPKDGNHVVIGKAMILCNYLYLFSCLAVGRDSSVGIASRYGLDGAGIESRRRERFSAPFQTGPRNLLYNEYGVIPGIKAGAGWGMAWG